MVKHLPAFTTIIQEFGVLKRGDKKHGRQLKGFISKVFPEPELRFFSFSFFLLSVVRMNRILF
jgi:hypothetical protein